VKHQKLRGSASIADLTSSTPAQRIAPAPISLYSVPFGLPYSVPFGIPFQKMFGPSRSTQHGLIRRKEIESALVGERRGRRVIIVASYLAYLERQRGKEADGEIGSPSPNPRARARSDTVEVADTPPKHGYRSRSGARA
jgi:hypothetical protein